MLISWAKYFTIAAFFIRKENHHKNILQNTLLSNLVCTRPLRKVLNIHLNFTFCLVSLYFCRIFFGILRSLYQILPLTNIFYTIYHITFFKYCAGWDSATFLHFECVSLNYEITVLHFDEVHMSQIPWKNQITLTALYVFFLSLLFFCLQLQFN